MDFPEHRGPMQTTEFPSPYRMVLDTKSYKRLQSLKIYLDLKQMATNGDDVKALTQIALPAQLDDGAALHQKVDLALPPLPWISPLH